MSDNKGFISAIAALAGLVIGGAAIHSIDKKKEKKHVKEAHDEGYKRGTNDTKQEIIDKIKNRQESQKKLTR